MWMKIRKGSKQKLTKDYHKKKKKKKKPLINMLYGKKCVLAL
jgi:hypothetical protein